MFGCFSQKAPKERNWVPAKKLAVFAVAVVCALSAAGATMSDFVAKSIVTDGGTLPYREALVNAGG